MRTPSYQALPQWPSASFSRFTTSSCTGAGSALTASVFVAASGRKLRRIAL
jgi:hypothetical protein